MKKNCLICCLLCLHLLFPTHLLGEENLNVEKVYLVFKTHLDIGFTDLPSVVENNYIHNFIPKALDVADKLRKDGLGDRYVWTTGSWLIWQYLQKAPKKDIARLEKAIERGDIVWNGMPYTMETETMNEKLLESTLLISKTLDKRFGKKTIAGKMTDVPGHTRGIISVLNKVGIQFLHVGVNPGSPVPKVPECCLWKDGSGHEIVLVYQADYGSETVLPDGKTVINVQVTGDNRGPHTYENVKQIYSNMRKRYPNAQIIGSNFNEIAQEFLKIKDRLPVVTSEIGDTWVYGFGSSPIRMAKFRRLSNLYVEWLKEGKLKQDDRASLNFALELGLIAEHTQGLDVKTFLKNWDKYEYDAFVTARKKGVFSKPEAAWRDMDRYIDKAIAYLPENLQKEAWEEVKKIDSPRLYAFGQEAKAPKTPEIWSLPLLDGHSLVVSGLSYEMFDSHDFDCFFNNYNAQREIKDWMKMDFGKPGLDSTHAVSVSLPAVVVKSETKTESDGIRMVSELAFPQYAGVDARYYPEKMVVNSFSDRNGRKAEIDVTIWNKPAVRMPEAYWLSFKAKDIVSIMAQKMGQEIDVFDVVENGARQLHGINQYVDIKTSRGTFRIWSETALLVNVGEARGLNFSTNYPDKAGGIHFNLSNNLWGTNFQMWNEGSLTYHFKVELL